MKACLSAVAGEVSNEAIYFVKTAFKTFSLRLTLVIDKPTNKRKDLTNRGPMEVSKLMILAFFKM